jgi:hypothetical protein
MEDELVKPYELEIGAVYHNWTVVALAPKGPRGHTRYVFRCKCGTERIKVASTVRTGRNKSCRNCRHQNQPIDITGQTFGKLTVVEQVSSNGNGARWRCRCACGNEVIKHGTALRAAHNRSCKECIGKTLPRSDGGGRSSSRTIVAVGRITGRRRRARI